MFPSCVRNAAGGGYTMASCLKHCVSSSSGFGLYASAECHPSVGRVVPRPGEKRKKKVFLCLPLLFPVWSSWHLYHRLSHWRAVDLINLLPDWWYYCFSLFRGYSLIDLSHGGFGFFTCNKELLWAHFLQACGCRQTNLFVSVKQLPNAVKNMFCVSTIYYSPLLQVYRVYDIVKKCMKHFIYPE